MPLLYQLFFLFSGRDLKKFHQIHWVGVLEMFVDTRACALPVLIQWVSKRKDKYYIGRVVNWMHFLEASSRFKLFISGRVVKWFAPNDVRDSFSLLDMNGCFLPGKTVPMAPQRASRRVQHFYGRNFELFTGMSSFVTEFFTSVYLVVACWGSGGLRWYLYTGKM